MPRYYGGDFDRYGRGSRGGMGYGYGSEFGAGARPGYGYGYGEDFGARGEYNAFRDAQYEGDFGDYAGVRGYPGAQGGYGQRGSERGAGPGRGYGGQGFGRHTGAREYGAGQSGMAGRPTQGYAGTRPSWDGRTGANEYGFATPSGRYGSGGFEPGIRGGTGGLSTRASDIMTENPECVTPETAISDVAKRMRSLDVGIIPVVDDMDNRRLAGVVTDRDLAIRALAEGKDGSVKVSECMTADVHAVNKNDSVDAVMDIMQTDQVRRVPVTDREGRLVGIIAQADLAVDYGQHDDDREMRVEHTLERISEPARPRRGAFPR